MICPDINNPEVRNEFEILSTFVAVPYTIWNANGGYELSKTPDGKDSLFYNSLLRHYGNEVTAIKKKTEYLLNKNKYNAEVDVNGEPTYQAWYKYQLEEPSDKKVIGGVLPLKGNEKLYEQEGLLNSKGNIKTFPYNQKTQNFVKNLNKNKRINKLVLRKISSGRAKIFILSDTPIKGYDRYEDITGFYRGDAQLAEQENKQDSIFYQNNTNQTDEDYVASEKTIRDLAERMADRIGLKVRYESDRTKDYKGKLEDNTAVINLAYATLDTPIHEILGHPIIRALKTGKGIKEFPVKSSKLQELYPNIYKFDGVNQEEFNENFKRDEELAKEQYLKDNPEVAKEYNSIDNNFSKLYQNLLKELETGRGKEVFERIKRDYQLKSKPEIIEMESMMSGENTYEVAGKEFNNREDAVKYQQEQTKYYTSEEHQEEAIVELVGLYTADRLDKTKDGKLISLLKRLLKEMKAYMKSLFSSKEVNIDSLPDQMTLGDIADLLAYSNSKLILPGNEVVYTTPDNQTFKTYQEASNHISELIKQGEVDLSKEFTTRFRGKQIVSVKEYDVNEPGFRDSGIKVTYSDGTTDSFSEQQPEYKELLPVSNLIQFISKNKEYEQSKEIIEEWKKVNDIKYDPEEVYSRGQGFYSVVGAYSDFDVDLMFQNLLAHIQDNKKAGGEFTISAFTKPIDKQIGHLEGGGGKIKFKIFPKSKDIKWAANTDVYSGSVWDASEKVSKDAKSEIIGVSYTKAPALINISTIQPNLAAIIDDLAHHHNELGIELTGSNFRLEYDNDIPYSTKKIINNINSILDQKFGKLVEPEINYNNIAIKSISSGKVIKYVNLESEAYEYIDSLPQGTKSGQKGDFYIDFIEGKQPTQAKESLKEGIKSISNKIIKQDVIFGEPFKINNREFRFEYFVNENRFELNELERLVEGGTPRRLNRVSVEEAKQLGIQQEFINKQKQDLKDKENIEKEYTSQAEINTKIAALKKGQRKFPRSLIRSNVQKIQTRNNIESELFAPDELPFQKIPSTNTYQEALNNLDRKLIDILESVNIKPQVYENLKEKLGVDALGFTELAFGNAEIGVHKFRNRQTFPEEASHVFIAMLNDNYKNRLFNLLRKDDYYKQVLGKDFEAYKEQYNNDTDALVNEAGGKLLSDVFIKKELSVDQIPSGNLLKRIWSYLKDLISRVSFNRIEREVNLLTEDIADQILNNNLTSIGKLDNITPVGTGKKIKTLLQVNKKEINNENKLLEDALRSVSKRLNLHERSLDAAKTANNKKRQEKLQEMIEEDKKLQKSLRDKLFNGNQLLGVQQYLTTLSSQSEDFEKAVNDINKKLKDTDYKDLPNIGSRLSTMKYTIDINLNTLNNIEKELNQLFLDLPEFKQELNLIEELAGEQNKLFKRLLQNYYDLGNVVVSESFKHLLGDRNNQDILDAINLNRKDKLKPLDLENALKETEGDINFMTRWLDALSDTPDDVVKLIDVFVKEAKQKANLQALDDRKDLLVQEEKITKNKIRNDFVAERDSKGKITGDFITEQDWTAFKNLRKEFFDTLNKSVKKNFKVETYSEFLEKSDKLSDEYGFKEYKDAKKDYGKQISKFFSKYTYSIEEVENLEKTKGKVWMHFNSEVNTSGRIIVPKIKSKQYQSIESNKSKKEYYEHVLNLKYELDKYVPSKMRRPRRLPQIRQDLLQRLKKASKERDKGAFINVLKEATDVFTVREDEDTRGMSFALSNDQKSEVKFLPLYYISKLEDPEELALDITSTMSMLAASVRDFSQMSKIKDVLDISKDLIKEREIYELDKNGNPIVESIKVFGDKLLRNIKKHPLDNQIAQRLEDYFNMVVYGEYIKDLGKIKGTNIDKAKLVQAYTKYVSINSLGFNLFAGTANIINGKVMTGIDKKSREFVAEKSLRYADKRFVGDLGNILNGVGSVDGKGHIKGKYSKANLFFERNDVLQDFNQRTKELHAGRKNFFSRMFNMSSIFFINRAGEYWLQGRMSLALAYEYRYDTSKNKFVWKSEFYQEVKNLERKRQKELSKLEKPTKEQVKKITDKYKEQIKKANEKLDKQWEGLTNYYEAQEVSDNKIKLKEEFKDNFEDYRRFVNRTNSINKSLHGIYNDIDKSAAQQYMWFNVINQFRKWMIPFWNRRYQKTQFNYERDAWTEGYYRTAAGFLNSLVREWKNGEMSIRKSWHLLSEMEKANVRRAATETAHVLGFLTLAFILSGLDWDDDEALWIQQMAAYQASRMITEVGSMTPSPLMFSEGMRVLKRPIPGSTQVENLLTLMTPWEWWDEIERGKYKGMTRFERSMIKGTPVVSQVSYWNSVEEKMVFFNR